MKDAILADNARFFEAYLEAMGSGNPNDPLVLTYATPSGARLWVAAVSSEHAKGLTVTGTDHLYKRVVDIKDPTTADVTVCDDQSKAFDKEIATGKVHQTPVTDSDYLLYFFRVKKTQNGPWQIVDTIIHQNDAPVKQECR